MLKKITSFMLAALTTLTLTLALAPAQNAAAWDEVCVKFPLWRTAFVGRFLVIHNHDFYAGAPSFVPDRDYPRLSVPILKSVPGPRSRGARQALYSGDFTAGKSRCVSIRHVTNNSSFAVFAQTTWGQATTLCSTHSSNPNIWYNQQQRPYRKIWFEAWGAAGSPRCAYWRETN